MLFRLSMICVGLVISTGVTAQMRPFDIHTQQTNPDPLFQQAALFISGAEHNQSTQANPFLKVSDVSVFEGHWDYISAIYMGDEYLFYVGDIHVQACVPYQDVEGHDHQWSKYVLDSFCQHHAMHIQMLNTYWTNDGCAILKASPSRKVCMFLDPQNSNKIEHIRLYQQESS